MSAKCRRRTDFMRISFVLNHVNLNGGIRVIAIYAERLKKRGHQVTVVTRPRPVPSFKSRIKSLVKGNGWPIDPNTLADHFDNVDVDIRVIEQRRPIVDRDVPDGDVVIATWWETADWVNALSPSKGAKAYFVQDFGANDSQPIDMLAATWLLPMHRIVISQYIMDLVKQHADDGREMSYVPNSVDLQQFNSPPRQKNKSPVVGTMYSASPFKGFLLALEAVQRARKILPDLQLHGFGSSTASDKLRDLPWLKLSSRVPDDKLKNIYAECDAWLFPPRKEGYGLPILEAMACRTPVIATPAGAAPELINAHGGGMLVPHEDPAAMADAIVKICSLTDNEWRQLSDAAYATVSGYSWDDATDRFEAALMKTANAEVRMQNAE
jgi:glycosyltransferase involved in cell wall biosynthesis